MLQLGLQTSMTSYNPSLHIIQTSRLWQELQLAEQLRQTLPDANIPGSQLLTHIFSSLVWYPPMHVKQRFSLWQVSQVDGHCRQESWDPYVPSEQLLKRHFPSTNAMLVPLHERQVSIVSQDAQLAEQFKHSVKVP